MYQKSPPLVIFISFLLLLTIYNVAYSNRHWVTENMKALTYNMYIELILYEQARSHFYRASARGRAERVMGSRFEPQPTQYFLSVPITLYFTISSHILYISFQHRAFCARRRWALMAWHLTTIFYFCLDVSNLLSPWPWCFEKIAF